jgi:hypothetical protein
VATVGGATTVTLSGIAAVSELASDTWTVKLLVPVPVGVPEITPVLEARDNPVGRVPEVMDQVYGGVPPLAVSVALYAAFCVPFGMEVVVTTGTAGPPAAKVATRAVQLGLPLSVKEALYDPVEVTSMNSFAAGELPVSFSSMVNPLPADCVPE